METRACLQPFSQLQKSLPLVLRFYFPFLGCYGGRWRRNSLIAQLTPDLWRSVEIFALCLELLKREKKCSLQTWKQKHWFVLLGLCHSSNDNLLFSGAPKGWVSSWKTDSWENVKFCSYTFHSPLCVPPSPFPLINSPLQGSEPYLTGDFFRKQTSPVSIHSTYEELRDCNLLSHLFRKGQSWAVLLNPNVWLLANGGTLGT